MVFDEYNIKNRYRKNPLLSQFSSSLPTDMKDMFKWMEFILFNAPIASAGVKKLSETPVTSFRYTTEGDENESSKSKNDSWKQIIEKKLDLKSKLLSISYNTLAYGNQFISVYTPFTRNMVCSSCGEMHRIEESVKLKVTIKKNNTNSHSTNRSSKNTEDLSSIYKKTKEISDILVFTSMCKKEKKVTIHTIKDIKIKDSSLINVIQWNPFNIEISTNSISGKNIYYYRPETSIVAGVKSGDPEILNSMPIGMIVAVLDNKIFRFSDGHLYHVKRDTLNGVSSAWGMPALAPAIPAFLNTMILKKANEKIASDYLVPLRVMYPTQTAGQDQVYNYISGTDFVGKINNLIDKWKQDPSAVQTAPFPVGVQNILGDGKMLSVYQELEQSEISIASTLGIPIEFIKGGLSYSGQGASLRLLENQMSKVSAGLNGCIEFIIEKVSASLKKSPVKVELMPFKIIDDMQEKATIVQLALQNGGISKATLMEIFNMDAQSEKDRIVQEAKDGIVDTLEVEQFQKDKANSIQNRANAMENIDKGSFNQLDQQSLIAEADEKVSQIAQMDEGNRRSILDEMSKTNYILYSVVKARLDMMNNKKKD